MSDWALWLKALHIMAFAAWMAAMWYLPRLMVYHASLPAGEDRAAPLLATMQRRLLRAIGTPAMIATFVFGIALASVQHQWTDGWLHAKLLLVLGITACHGILAKHVRQFGEGLRPKGEVWYRVFNEIPTVLFIGIVLLAVFKPW